MPFRRQETIAVAFGHNTLRDESLLLHSRLGAQRSGHIVQISDLIPLVCGKGNRLDEAVAASRHPAVHAQGGRYRTGQITVIAIEPFDFRIVRLGNKGLHLHIVCRHQGTGNSVQIDAFITLVDMVCLQRGGFAIWRSNP